MNLPMTSVSSAWNTGKRPETSVRRTAGLIWRSKLNRRLPGSGCPAGFGNDFAVGANQENRRNAINRVILRHIILRPVAEETLHPFDVLVLREFLGRLDVGSRLRLIITNRLSLPKAS